MTSGPASWIRSSRGSYAGGGRTPSGFTEAANQAASISAVGLSLLATGSAYLLGRRWWDGVGEAFRVVPIFYVLVVLGALLCTVLLAARARMTGDETDGWIATGIGVAGIAALGQLVAVMRLSDVPWELGADGLASLYLLWHAALVVFPLGALLAPAATWCRSLLATAFGVAVVMACADHGSRLLPDLVGERDVLTPLHGSLLTGLMIGTVTALLLWILAAGRRPTRPQVWIGVLLGFAAVDLLVAGGATQLFESIWWSSGSLRAAQFAIPAVGLLADGLGLMRLLSLHERGLSERLEQERELAVRLLHAPPASEEEARRIRHILEHRRFRIVFQPIYSLRTGRLIAVEALTRFTPESDRSPDEWFDVANRCGLGVELELAVLDRALEEAAELPREVALTVNLSPAAVTDSRLREHLRGAQIPCLVVEITEHAPVDDYLHLTRALTELRQQGVLVAIDDAGAGFSSLRHVVHLSPDIIKLDMTLTRDVHRDPVRRALAASLTQFAEEMGIELIAEGVETAEELAALQAIGAHAAQGYLLARPDDLAAVLCVPPLTPVPPPPASDLEVVM